MPNEGGSKSSSVSVSAEVAQCYCNVLVCAHSVAELSDNIDKFMVALKLQCAIHSPLGCILQKDSRN